MRSTSQVQQSTYVDVNQINKNIKASQEGNQSSNFGQHVTIENQLAEDGKGTTGTTTNGYKVSNGADSVIAKVDLEHPIVQSRINVKTGDTEAGWVHVQNRHFSDKTNASQFTISQSELKTILQSNKVLVE